MPLTTPEEETAFVERIAEAVIRRIDEREKIALLADAVLERLGEHGPHTFRAQQRQEHAGTDRRDPKEELTAGH